MCDHAWKKIGESKFCVKCGIIKLPNGEIYFDRELITYREPKKKKKGKENGKN